MRYKLILFSRNCEIRIADQLHEEDVTIAIHLLPVLY